MAKYETYAISVESSGSTPASVVGEGERMLRSLGIYDEPKGKGKGKKKKEKERRRKEKKRREEKARKKEKRRRKEKRKEAKKKFERRLIERSTGRVLDTVCDISRMCAERKCFPNGRGK
jgi:hypothetical protein